jgi:hypothetical protein
VIGTEADQELMRKMGLDLDLPDSGCCGMAGSFGYQSGEQYEVSIAAGERVILPAVRAADQDTLVLADGFSCRGQIRQGTDRDALHLAEVLAMAARYGSDGPPDERPPRSPSAGRRKLGAVLAAAGATAVGVAGALAGDRPRERRRR